MMVPLGSTQFSHLAILPADDAGDIGNASDAG